MDKRVGMELTTFYALVSGTCFTLLGLWWSVVQKHPEWRTSLPERRFAGGVYLSFLLPATMSLVAEINPGRPFFWRTVFVLAGLTGLVAVWRLPATVGPPGARGSVAWPAGARWLVGLLYGVHALLGAWPESARLVGLAPLEAGAIALVALVLAAHALAWSFIMAVPAETSQADG